MDTPAAVDKILQAQNLLDGALQDLAGPPDPPDPDPDPDPDPGGLVIPPTVAYPTTGFRSGGGFTIIGSCIDNDDVRCDETAGGKRTFFELDYWAHGLPYLFNGDGSDGAWWLGGDRQGYEAAYGFLQTGKHIHETDTFENEEIIGRFTVVRPFGQSYGKVNDKYMDEGVRYYDGSVVDPRLGAEIREEDARAVSITPGEDYDALEFRDGPGEEPRVGFFTAAGDVVDIRDYGDVVPQTPGRFFLLGFDGARATIAFVPDATKKVGLLIYYDALGTGRIAVENGVA